MIVTPIEVLLLAEELDDEIDSDAGETATQGQRITEEGSLGSEG